MPYVWRKQYVPYSLKPATKFYKKKPFKWVPRKQFLANLKRKKTNYRGKSRFKRN